jgi:molybdenum cofactor guanylyltransferase
MRVAGAVLCGGRSSRMGTDKAGLVLGGSTFAQRAAIALAGGGCDPVVAVGGSPFGLTVVDDGFAGDGPLGGVVTALEHFADHDAVCVVATDLPMLDAATVGSIVAALAESGADVAVASSGRLEPMCAAWRTVLAPYLRASLFAGLRAVHGAFGQLDVVEVAVDAAVLRNVNTPDDRRSLG